MGREPLQAHPVADLFPLMEGSVYIALLEDMRQHGQREPVVLHPDGRILDGRNRYRACQEIGLPLSTITWDGNGTELNFVLSLNLHRRHLDESQRAMVAAKVANLKDGQQAASIEAAVTQPEAAEMLNVSRASVQRARKILEKGSPELIAGVEQGRVTVSAAARKCATHRSRKSHSAAQKAYNEFAAAAERMYKEAKETAERAYQEAIAPAQQVYDEAERVYRKAIAPAREVRDNAVNVAWHAYRKTLGEAKRRRTHAAKSSHRHGAAVAPIDLESAAATVEAQA